MARPVRICSLGTVPYGPTADLQRRLRAARERDIIGDTILVLQHDPVVTAGYRTEPSEIAMAETMGLPVEPTERGGKATYHGPGQVVVYPIIDLDARGGDVRQFVRGLEQAIIDVLREHDVHADRRAEYPGVWVDGRKIGSIGIRVTRGCTFHGIALNVDCDLEAFSWFTPCGIADVTMTSIARERAGLDCPDVDVVARALAETVAAELSSTCEWQSIDELERSIDGVVADTSAIDSMRAARSLVGHHA